MPVTIQREGRLLAVHPRNGARLVATCCTQCHGFGAAILPATEASRALPAGGAERWNRHAPPWLRVEEQGEPDQSGDAADEEEREREHG